MVAFYIYKSQRTIPIMFITKKKQHCQSITFALGKSFNMYKDAMFEQRNGIYAHPLIVIFSASSREPIIAPHKEICSISVLMINSSMKIKEAVAQPMITHLLQLCKVELRINELPEIQLLDTEPTVGGGTAFGEFDGDSIRVVTMGRHPMDVARTLAHELVHWKQMTDGDELDGSDGSSTENEANAVAGVIMRKFAKMFPDYFLESLP